MDWKKWEKAAQRAAEMEKKRNIEALIRWEKKEGWIQDHETGIEWLSEPLPKEVTLDEAEKIAKQMNARLPEVDELLDLADHLECFPEIWDKLPFKFKDGYYWVKPIGRQVLTFLGFDPSGVMVTTPDEHCIVWPVRTSSGSGGRKKI